MRPVTLCLLSGLLLAFGSECSFAADAPAIPESAHLAVIKERGTYSGDMSVEAKSTNCREISLRANTANLQGAAGYVKIDRKSPGGMADVRRMGIVETRGGPVGEVWAVDVLYTFRGRVCLPSRWWDRMRTFVDITYAPQQGGSIAMVGGALVSSTPVQIKGEIYFVVPNDVEVLEVSAAAADRIQFRLTSQGLRHVGGAGSVATPRGKRYDFGGTR